ncbi:MAG: dihydrodipicolinate synthase family protein [Verrucomicrobiales bacterium]|nr:dihydrodipicolinate synthase family protein [Verrucomicrobiales bacterium]MCP5527745.1 dihydrodipicolinate synthase family protein [Verrucomicrobiales bacterium]
MASGLNLPLRGIVPPMITPLRGRDELDVAGLERLIEHILAGGVAGLFILGTSGEAPSLSYRLRRELIERVCRQVNGRVPVLAGITDTSFVEMIGLSRHAAGQGVSALVTATPYYFPSGQPELIEHLEHLLPELPLPLMLYNMPSMTKVSFARDTVRWAVQQPGIIGIKDSSGDMLYFHDLIDIARARPDWAVFVGPEELMAEVVLLGGHGGVNGGANFKPRLYVDLYEAAAARDLERMLELNRQVQAIARAVYRVGRHASAVIKGMKGMLSLMGICDDYMAEPFHRFRPAERQELERRARGLGLLP